MGKKTSLRVLVAFEESQAVTKEFRKLGHEAFSCDLLKPSGGHPEWHIQDDVLNHIDDDWDIIIAFPPCTHLSVSGARWFPEKRREQADALAMFLMMLHAPAPRVAVENPVSIASRIRPPDQVIQPWMFGHGETKGTCLWLRGLPVLEPTNIVDGREPRVHMMPPSPDRAKLRSKTYPGVAKAMAEQWGVVNEKQEVLSLV